VWSGTDAKKIGLIDEFGGLDEAIAIAAKKVNLTAYRITNLPEQKEPFEQFFSSMNEQASTYWAQQQFGLQYEWYKNIKHAIKYEGVQMRLPIQLDIQ
jgi:protease-4